MRKLPQNQTVIVSVIVVALLTSVGGVAASIQNSEEQLTNIRIQLDTQAFNQFTQQPTQQPNNTGGQDPEPNDDPTQAVGLQPDQPVNGTISNSEDVDWYYINASQGDQINVLFYASNDVVAPNGSSGSLLLVSVRPEGQLIANVSGTVQSDSTVGLTIRTTNQTGSYYFGIGAGAGAGSYALVANTTSQSQQGGTTQFGTTTQSGGTTTQTDPFGAVQSQHNLIGDVKS